MDIDKLLTPTECAEWLQISTGVLSEQSQGRRARIPAIHITQRSVRYHPRTILAKFAAEGGVAPEIIAAAFAHWDKCPSCGMPVKKG